MAGWTNKSAIIRDLAQAQGQIPVDIERLLPFNVRPPREIYERESEEELYSAGYSTLNISIDPDFDAIQEMLAMVRETDVSNVIKNDCYVSVVKNSRQNTPTLPENQVSSIIKEQNNRQHVTKKTKNRNAAMESLLLRSGDNDSATKPKKYILPSKCNKLNERFEHVEEVNKENKASQWFDALHSGLGATNMFKKKAYLESKEKSSEASNEAETTESTINSQIYVPSPVATHYYEMYLERNKTQQKIKEDIWTRTQHLLKEVDERKSNNKKSSSYSESEEMISPPLLTESSISPAKSEKNNKNGSS